MNVFISGHLPLIKVTDALLPTMEEIDFLSRHEEKIPATMEKLDKEKLALLKEIGVVVRRITREQEKLSKKKTKQRKNNNRKKRKKEV